MKELEKKIKESYIDYISEHKKRPYSLSSFMQAIEHEEADFYRCFHSLQELEKLIWKDFFEITRNSIQAADEYEEFPVMDKVKVFYYTLFNVMQPSRDFAIFSFNQADFWEITPSCLSMFCENFEFFAQDIVNEGIESGEIASRPFISDYYSRLMWGQTLIVIKTWVTDTSEDFDRSDAAVEKATTFAFDVMSRGLFDSGFDLAKFLLNKS